MRQGSVTVFFSLVGILIVALLGTLVETARYTACAQHGKRTLQTGCDALLTEYSKPLYDRYRLFAIEDTPLLIGGTETTDLSIRTADSPISILKKVNLAK